MLITPAYAQAASGAAPGAAGGSAFLVQALPLVLVFLVFWLLILRPQSKRMKEHKAKLNAVKKGDQVITGGGLIGKVARVLDDNFIEIELAPNLKVRAVKSTLTDVIDPTSAPAAND